MSTSSAYRITYHFEKNGKRVSETFQDTCLLSATDVASVYTVLSNNNKIPGGYGQSNLYVESIGHVGAASQFLS